MTDDGPELDLLDLLPEGDRLKSEGQAMALDAQPTWTGRALVAIRQLAAEQPTLTADDLVDRVGLPRGHRGSNRNNAVGAVFSAAQRLGYIAPTDEVVKSSRPSNHSALIRVWKKARA